MIDPIIKDKLNRGEPLTPAEVKLIAERSNELYGTPLKIKVQQKQAQQQMKGGRDNAPMNQPYNPTPQERAAYDPRNYLPELQYNPTPQEQAAYLTGQQKIDFMRQMGLLDEPIEAPPVPFSAAMPIGIPQRDQPAPPVLSRGPSVMVRATAQPAVVGGPPLEQFVQDVARKKQVAMLPADIRSRTAGFQALNARDKAIAEAETATQKAVNLTAYQDLLKEAKRLRPILGTLKDVPDAKDMETLRIVANAARADLNHSFDQFGPDNVPAEERYPVQILNQLENAGNQLVEYKGQAETPGAKTGLVRVKGGSERTKDQIIRVLKEGGQVSPELLAAAKDPVSGLGLGSLRQIARTGAALPKELQELLVSKEGALSAQKRIRIQKSEQSLELRQARAMAEAANRDARKIGMPQVTNAHLDLLRQAHKAELDNNPELATKFREKRAAMMQKDQEIGHTLQQQKGFGGQGLPDFKDTLALMDFNARQQQYATENARAEKTLETQTKLLEKEEIEKTKKETQEAGKASGAVQAGTTGVYGKHGADIVSRHDMKRLGQPLHVELSDEEAKDAALLSSPRLSSALTAARQPDADNTDVRLIIDNLDELEQLSDKALNSLFEQYTREQKKDLFAYGSTNGLSAGEVVWGAAPENAPERIRALARRVGAFESEGAEAGWNQAQQAMIAGGDAWRALLWLIGIKGTQKAGPAIKSAGGKVLSKTSGKITVKPYGPRV